MAVSTSDGVPTWTPNRKVMAGSLSGAIVTILSFVAQQYAGVTFPPALSEALVLLFGFGAAYLVPPAPNEGVSSDASGPRKDKGHG